MNKKADNYKNEAELSSSFLQTNLAGEIIANKDSEGFSNLFPSKPFENSSKHPKIVLFHEKHIKKGENGMFQT